MFEVHISQYARLHDLFVSSQNDVVRSVGYVVRKVDTAILDRYLGILIYLYAMSVI